MKILMYGDLMKKINQLLYFTKFVLLLYLYEPGPKPKPYVDHIL